LQAKFGLASEKLINSADRIVKFLYDFLIAHFLTDKELTGHFSAVLGQCPGYFSGQALVQSDPPSSISICATVDKKSGGLNSKRGIAGKHVTLFGFIII
jgi:hypothetical protein